mmetsp:Transcript_20923/g.31424  ORF Transcript_20923/g.31424 Transcript_20923/m.31424 type:complete len:136 (+) Transcript_20923:83-490(+)
MDQSINNNKNIKIITIAKNNNLTASVTLHSHIVESTNETRLYSCTAKPRTAASRLSISPSLFHKLTSATTNDRNWASGVASAGLAKKYVSKQKSKSSEPKQESYPPDKKLLITLVIGSLAASYTPKRVAALTPLM